MTSRATFTFAFALALAGCSDAALGTPVVPPDMRWIHASADPLQWYAAGLVELTTPIRPPTSTDETAHVVVWMQLAPGATFGAAELPDGASAARVEYAGPARRPDAEVDASWRVLDVRAFAWRDGQRWCRVLRPAAAATGGLAGVEWRCSPAILGAIRQVTLRAVVDPLEALMRDDGAVERYRPVDSNHGDPLLRPHCPDSELAPDGKLCRDGLRPRMVLDVVAGMRREDAHVARVCASRRAVAAGMTLSPLHAEALAECAAFRSPSSRPTPMPLVEPSDRR